MSNPAGFTEEYINFQYMKLIQMRLPRRLDELRTKVQACILCPDMVRSRCLYRYQRPTFGYGNPKSRIFIIAQSPGYKGCGTTGMPFEPKSRTGRVYEEILTAAGLGFGTVWTTNLVKCCPEGSDPPTGQNVESCTPLLLNEIYIINPKHLVAVGLFARHFLEKHHLWRNFEIHSIFHPGYALRGGTDLTEYIKESTDLFRKLKGWFW